MIIRKSNTPDSKKTIGRFCSYRLTNDYDFVYLKEVGTILLWLPVEQKKELK
jgi:hypothetical protein